MLLRSTTNLPVREPRRYELLDMALFQADLTLADSRIVPGTHYACTLRAWLARLDTNADQALELLRATVALSARRGGCRGAGGCS
jgi:cyclopropane fatty-acyl-phospholipid synthase-like methyltransferase